MRASSLLRRRWTHNRNAQAEIQSILTCHASCHSESEHLLLCEAKIGSDVLHGLNHGFGTAHQQLRIIRRRIAPGAYHFTVNKTHTTFPVLRRLRSSKQSARHDEPIHRSSTQRTRRRASIHSSHAPRSERSTPRTAHVLRRVRRGAP